MDMISLIDHGSTITETERRLERDRDRIERILERRPQYVEMIDWSAMTEKDRDWGLHGLPYELYTQLWEIDTQLTNFGCQDIY